MSKNIQVNIIKIKNKYRVLLDTAYFAENCKKKKKSYYLHASHCLFVYLYYSCPMNNARGAGL